MRKQSLIIITALCLMAALTLSGCQVGKTDVILAKGLTDHEVFRVNDQICSLAQAKVLLINYQNIYGRIQTGQTGSPDQQADLWSMDLGTDALEQDVKDLTVSQLAQIMSMSLLAKHEEIKLNNTEKEAVQAAAHAYYASLNEDELSYTKAKESDIEKMYTEYALANKVYDQLTTGGSEQGIEISDDEARIITVQKIFVGTPERAAEVEEKLNGGGDFLAVAMSYNEAGETQMTLGRGELPKEADEAAFSMNDGQVAGPIQTGDGYYFLKCMDKFDRDLTDAHKKEMLEQKKKAAFYDVYDVFVDNAYTELNEKLWKKVKIEDKEGITTRDFFRVYEEHVQ